MTNYKTKKGRELLVRKIEDYFLLCDSINGENDEKRNTKPIKKPYTLSGLLYHLDMSVNELHKLSEIRSLSRIISGAKRRIEAYIEENSLNGNLSSTAAFNSLKEHFGWSEKKQSDSDEEKGFSIELCGEAETLGR